MSINIFNNDVLSALSTGGYTQDRLPGDILTLPEAEYSIKIKVNDLVISETINYSLSKLYNNWLYLISKSIIPSNNIPNSDFVNKMIVDKSSSGIGWTDTYDTIDEFELASSDWSRETSLLEGVEQITKVQNVADPNNYNIIANTSTNIILLSGTDTTSIDIIGNYFNQLNIILSNSDVTHPSNEILFRDIANHVITDDRELFVLDKYHRTIFKFDISGILTLDKAILQNDTPGRLMTGMIGGPGDIQDKTRFASPQIIETVNNLIYAIDHTSTESVIKVFDSDLNWKRSVTLGNVLGAGPLDMSYNDMTRKFYILCHAGTTAFNNGESIDYNIANRPATLVILDENLQYIETVSLSDDSYSSRINTERYRKVYFSLENKNIMYIVTNKGVFKKYVSRPERFIGQFLLEEKNIGVGDSVQNFADMSIFPAQVVDNDVDVTKDEILLLDKSRRTIFQFFEDSNYERSIQTEFDDKALFFERMQVQDEEYVSTLTYNKVLTKHMYNNMLLLENTYRKFTTKFNRYGISQYIGFRYLNKDELEQTNYVVPMNAYIGNNELLLSATINRCLNQILLLQENILDKMQEKSINVFPLITSPVILNSPYIEIGEVTGLDTDSDGVPDTLDPDDDDDGLTDVQEAQYGSDPLQEFTDQDAWSDYDEVTIHGTDPSKSDTDDDLIVDSSDAFPLDGAAWMDTDQDRKPDDVYRSPTVVGQDDEGQDIVIPGNPGSPLVEDQDDDDDGYSDVLETQIEQQLKDEGVTIDGVEIVPGTLSKNWRRVNGVDSDLKFIDRDGYDSIVPIFDTLGNILTAANPDGIDDAVDIDIDGDTYLNFEYNKIWIVDPTGNSPTYKTTNLTVLRQLNELQQDVDYFVRVDENGIPLTHPNGSVVLRTESSADFDNVITRADGVDTDNDGIDDLLDPDDDNDLLPDVVEIQSTVNHPYITSPTNPDTDGDTVSDYDEYQDGTDPTNIDTDSDMDKLLYDVDGNIISVGVSGRDDQDAFPTDPAGFRDTDGDLKPDEFVHTGIDPTTQELSGQVVSTTGLTEDEDDDDDNLTDVEEQDIGTDPKSKDTDSDTLEDFDEVQAGSNPLEPGLVIIDTSDPEYIQPTLTRLETFTGVVSTDQELRGLFHNPDYLREQTPFELKSIENKTNTNNLFTLNSIDGLSMNTALDFETLQTNPLTAAFQAFDQQSEVYPGQDKTFIIQIKIDDFIEDTDGDHILDPEDDTLNTPALQFKEDVLLAADNVLTDSDGVVYRVQFNYNLKPAAIEENSNPVVLNSDLDALFVNPSYRGNTPYQLSGNPSVRAGRITGSKLELNTFDFETLFDTPNSSEARAVNIRARVSKGGKSIEVWYKVWVKNTDNEDTDQDGAFDYDDSTKDNAQLQLDSSFGTVDGNTMVFNSPIPVMENIETNTNIVSLTSLFINPDWIEPTGIEMIQGQDMFSITPATSTVQLLSGLDFEQLIGGDDTSRIVSTTINVPGQEELDVIQTLTFNVSVINETVYSTGKWIEAYDTWNSLTEEWQSLSED